MSSSCYSEYESDPESEPRGVRWRRNVILCLRKFAAFLLSHVGLSSVVVGYMILGGIIFMNLEGPNERLNREMITTKRRDLSVQLWKLSRKISASGRFFNWTEEADKLLVQYQKDVFHATKSLGWDGHVHNPELKWTFPGALLFSVTVVTTIGYGHLAPYTSLGRLVTITYAMVGIPLTLLCLSNVGQFLGGFFAIIYRIFISNFFSLLARIFLPRKSAFSKNIGRRLVLESMRADKEVTEQRTEEFPLNDIDQSDVEMASSVDQSQRATTDTLITIKNDDAHNDATHFSYVLQQTEEDFIPSRLENNSRKSKAVIFCAKNDEKTSRAPDTDTDKVKRFRKRRLSGRSRYKALKRLASIPISMAVVVIVLYIMCGAVLFTVWEKDWDYLIGLYFCFITLTTIGFGDYVPGITGQSRESQEKRILCVLYLLIGLALIAMCFHLVQQEVRVKLRRAAVKLGIERENADSEKTQ